MEILTLRHPARREILLAALILLAWLNVLFAPVIWGCRTLLLSAHGTSSIFPLGAYATGAHHDRITPPRVKDPGGTAWFAEPNHALLHKEICSDWQLPLWNPYNACGTPLMANMQSQPFNPVELVSDMVPASARTVDSYNVDRLLIAGVLTFCFVRLFCSFAASMLGACAFMQTGYFTLYLGMPDLSVCMFIPGLFFALEKLSRRRTVRNTIWSAVFTWLILIGGMPEVAFLAILAAALYFFIRVLTEIQNPRQRLRAILLFIFASICGLMLASPQVVPFLEYMRHSSNSHVPVAGEPARGAIFQQNFGLQFLPYLAPLVYGWLTQLQLTPATGSANFCGYWGLCAFTLMVIAVSVGLKRLRRNEAGLRARGEVLALFCGGMVLLCVAKRYGFPLVNWIGSLPIFSMVVFSKYLEPLAGFFVACAAACGLHFIQRRLVRTSELATCALLVVFLFGGLLAYDWHLTLSHRWLIGVGLLSVLPLVAVLFCSFLLIIGPTRNRFMALWAVATLAAELTFNYFVPVYYHVTGLPRRAFDPFRGAPYVGWLQAHTADSQYRISGYDGMLYPIWSSAFGLHDARALDAMYPPRYFDFLRAFCRQDEHFAQQPLELRLYDRFTGTEPCLDPMSSPEAAEAIQRLWQLTSTKYVVGLVDRRLPQATSLMLAAARNMVGPDSSHFQLRVMDVHGEQQYALFEHPEKNCVTTVTFSCRVPDNARFLYFRYGIDGQPVKRGVTDGAGFSIAILHDGTSEQVFHNSLDRAAGGAWPHEYIDVSRFRGRQIMIELGTNPGLHNDDRDDWAGWSSVQFTENNQPPASTKPALDWRLVYDKEARIFEVPDPLPRAAFFADARFAPSARNALAALTSHDFDPHREVVIEQNGRPPTPASGHEAAPCVAQRIVRSSPLVVEAEVDAKTNGYLLLTDTFYPGWRAEVDSVAAPILHANYLFRAVAIGPGKHLVRFVYEPRSFGIGCIIALGGFIGLLSLVLAGRRKRR